MSRTTRLTRRAFAEGVLVAGLGGCSREERPQSRRDPPIASRVPPDAPPLAPPPPAVFTPALLRLRPRIADHVAWLSIATLPTPVEHAATLAGDVGLPRLFVKRDDRSGARYGGGKTRKLAFLLAHAKTIGARELVTFGGIGSNQAVAVALHGAALGFAVTLLLAPGDADARVRDNLLAARRAGATLRLAPAGVAAAETEARAAEARGGPHVIPSGGSTPLGNLAFVDAALELAEQVEAGALPEPARLYVAMGTMGSAVGLSIGLALAGLSTEVVAVRTSNEATSSPARLTAMTRETLAFARALDPAFPPLRPRVRLLGTQLGRGYAIPTVASLRAVALAERHEGWRLEPTYTGKTLAALLAEEQRGSDEPVLFWCSHNSAPLETSGVSIDSFPPSLRRYVGPAVASVEIFR